MRHDFISDASVALSAAPFTEGAMSAIYLARARIALEGAKAACAELEILVHAREAEAVRAAATAEKKR